MVQLRTHCATATDTIKIRDVLSIQVLKSDELKVYLNPTRGTLNIQNRGKSIDYLDVLDYLGRSCWQSHHPLQTDGAHKMEFIEVPAGLYFISIEFTGGQKVTLPISIIK